MLKILLTRDRIFQEEFCYLLILLNESKGSKKFHKIFQMILSDQINYLDPNPKIIKPKYKGI